MKINVLFFATLREKLQTSSAELEVNGDTVSDALHAITEHYPLIRDWIEGKRVHIALNDEYVEKDSKIRENDTLALIPPVSGGCDG
ncbi:MAG: molybdopterin converting factor subunit 1 [bacterium]|jgi:molybdopterin synthase sulfur carrier subunit